MPTLENTFDGGTGVNLDSLTTANAGGSGNTQFDVVSTIAPKFSNTYSHTGSQCMVTATSGAQMIRASWTPANSNALFQRTYMRRNDNPATVSQVFMGCFVDDLTTTGLGTFVLRWHTDGFLHAFDSTSTSRWNSGTALPLSEWVRFETWQNRATGQARVKGWFGANLEAQAAPDIDSGVLTGLTMNTGTLWRAAFGNCAGNNTGTSWHDDVSWSSVDWIGPHVIGQPGVTTDVTVVMGAP